jgi:hypothetical protein
MFDIERSIVNSNFSAMLRLDEKAENSIREVPRNSHLDRILRHDVRSVPSRQTWPGLSSFIFRTSSNT